MCTSRTSKPARLRLRPPGPRALSRRSWVSWASGLVWSTTWLSSPRPKKYSIAALMLLGLMRVLGVMEFEDVADRVQVVQRAEGHLRFGDVLVELAVDAEAADFAQAVAVGVL